MDELLKALAEAVRNGSTLASPALHAYFVFKIIDTIAPVIGWVITVGVVTHLVKWCVAHSTRADLEMTRLKKGLD